MTQELRDQLYSYIGELEYKSDHSRNWMEQSDLIEEINLIYKLLNVDIKRETPMEKLLNIVKNYPK